VALQGLKVLDLSRLLPGPYASLVLADLGAQVDKVEDPQGGDYLRQMAPRVGEQSAMFAALNRNKRSLALDLKSPAGAAALRRLVRGYDVLIESFRPGVMEKLGLGYPTLCEAHPGLVYCALSGFGQTGPDRLRAGHDIGYLARSGVLGYGGAPDGPPALPGVQVADVGGGSLFAVVGILAALHERSRTGRGRFVDLSMTEGALAFLHMHLGVRLLQAEQGTPLRRGVEALNGGFPCYGVYRTSDGRHLAVGALEPKFFAGFCAALGRPDLLEFAYDTGEGGARAHAEIQEALGARPLAHWIAVFRPLDVCVEPVWEGDEVLADPQLNARGVFVKAHDPTLGREVTHLRSPLRFGDFTLRPAPALGEDGAVILSEAGFSEEEIRGLLSPG
jgi:alpha-methylacyl-CoA racemase